MLRMNGSRNRGMGWSSVLVVLAALVAPVPAWSQTGEKEADEKSQVLDDLALATQLTAFGRGELGDATGLKDVKSPEALVAAGGILLRIHKSTGGKLPALKAEITDNDGKAVPAEEKTTTLADDAEALFDEARAMAGDKGSAIEAAIKQASLVSERGAVGGPRSISRRVGSGKTHTVKIEMVSGQFAKVHMQGTGVTQFEVLGQNGKVLWHSKGNWGFYHWTPVGRDSRIITVKVINKGGPPVNYTIHTN
jgi:hypothetical protein